MSKQSCSDAYREAEQRGPDQEPNLLQFYFDSELCGGGRDNNGTLCIMDHDGLIT
jgi:hypothetical protein